MTLGLPDDPDVRLLFDLLALLPPMPGPQRRPPHDWWDDYAAAHNPGWDGPYYRGSLWAQQHRILNPDRGADPNEDVRRLAEYCLLFFADVVDNPVVCELLDVVAENYAPLAAGAVGRRWARSIGEVAWRLWVPREAARKRARAERAAEADRAE